MAIKERELEITLDVDWRIFSWNLKTRKGTAFTTT